MTNQKSLRYVTFALLYFSQGSILGYFTALNALYLQSFKIPLSLIGILGTIAMIPFVLKIFLGMLSDRYNFFQLGHRKPYIVIGLLIQMVCLLIIPSVKPDQQFWLFVGIAFLLQTGMALYDTCTDGLALDTTPKQEEGTVQGFMVGGRALGVIMAGGIGLIAQNISWQMAFFSLVILTLLPLPLVLFSNREPPKTIEHRFDWRAFSAFGKRSVLALGAFGALYSLLINGTNQLVNPFLSETFGISLATAGIITTTWGIGVVLGGMTGGKVVDRIGHRRSATWAMNLAFAAIFLISLIFKPSLVWVLVPLFGLAYGYYETVYFASSMQIVDLRIAASMFAILMAIANIGTGIGLGLAGILADTIGFRLTFVVLAAMNFLVLPLLPIIFPQEQKPPLLTQTTASD